MKKTKGHELIESLHLESAPKDDVGYDVICVIMTPEAAAKILSDYNYESNRKLRKTVRQQYVSDIRSGQWHTMACDPITISDTGKLINGQHRLMAIRDSGIPTLVEIRIGVPESEYPYFDHASKRNATDGLEPSTKRKTCIVSTCKALIRIQRFGEVTRSSVMTSGAASLARTITDADCLRYYSAFSERYPGALEAFAAFAYNKDVTIYGWIPGAISASCAIMCITEPAAYEDFKIIVTDREKYTPALEVFREWTRKSGRTWKNYNNTERNYMSYCAASIVWNELHGEKVKALRASAKCNFVGFNPETLIMD